jgi:hypothetical protein
MNLRSCKQKNNRERECRRVLPLFLQGLQRDFCSFSRELLLFLGGGCVLNDVFCGFKTQGAKRENNLPPPTGIPS